MNTDLTFEQLPNAIATLKKDIGELKALLLSRNEQGKHQPIEHPMPIEEAATFLGLSKPTIYSKVSKSELPYSKRGKRLYFFKSELLEYLKEGRQKTIN